MPPNTLRVHTDYVFVKSVGPKVLWAVAVETTGAGSWRIIPSPPVPCLKKVEVGGVAIHRVEVQPVSGSGNFHFYPSGGTQQLTH
ncbi:hypothetical protein TNCV_1209361 [Trichonephila clavipes]|nr:hypothetical protein TNCV_1209361 [Trichonephila clavipes]